MYNAYMWFDMKFLGLTIPHMGKAPGTDSHNMRWMLGASGHVNEIVSRGPYSLSPSLC